MDAWQALANAIVVQAADDFRTEYRKLNKLLAKEPPQDRMAKCDGNGKGARSMSEHDKWQENVYHCRAELSFIRRFFHSEWFELLSDADGPAIYRALEKEVQGI